MFRKIKNLFQKNSPINDSVNRIEVIPNRLFVDVFVHSIPINDERKIIKTLAYLTVGFSEISEYELILLLKNESEIYTNGPDDPIKFFGNLFHNIESGIELDSSYKASVKQPGILRWTGILFVEPPIYLKKEINRPVLCLVLLAENEFKSVLKFGAARILSMLGMSQSHYPYPHWSDVTREILPVDKMKELTKLGNSLIYQMPKFCHVRQEQNRIVLRLPKTINSEFPGEIINRNVAITLLTTHDNSAERHLVFNVENIDLNIIEFTNTNPNIIGGCFLMLVPNQEESLCLIKEDGFVFFSTPKAWLGFWDAYTKKESFYVKSKEGFFDLELIWY